MGKKKPHQIKNKMNKFKNGPIIKTKNKKKINTAHNLITFSMVFTNKNREGTLSPPPIITKVCKTPIITKVKGGERILGEWIGEIGSTVSLSVITQPFHYRVAKTEE